MNQRIKQLWVDALRSGDYKQGRRRLRTEDQYCCLGVLCDLYAHKHEGVSWTKSSALGSWAQALNIPDAKFGPEFHFLPLEVAMWADISTCPQSNKYGFLQELNDSGTSFNQIADIIEEAF